MPPVVRGLRLCLAPGEVVAVLLEAAGTDIAGGPERTAGQSKNYLLMPPDKYIGKFRQVRQRHLTVSVQVGSARSLCPCRTDKAQANK